MGFLSSVSKAGSILSAVVSTLTALYPLIVPAIEAAEAALGPGTGSAKLAVVVGSLKAAYSIEQTAVAAWESVEPAIVGVVNAVVAGYNAVHKGATPATPAAAT